MDVLMLSRLQFAAATYFHFLFVPLTLGLSVLVAIMETKYAWSGDETWLKMTKFWGKLFLINFAIGVVTGITLEFQFGTNWSRYSAFMGDIFGALLAIEALWLAIKTEGSLHDRAAAAAGKLWPVLLVAAVVFLVATKFTTPIYANYLKHPALFIFILITVIALLGIRVFLARKRTEYLGSGLVFCLTPILIFHAPCGSVPPSKTAFV